MSRILGFPRALGRRGASTVETASAGSRKPAVAVAALLTVWVAGGLDSVALGAERGNEAVAISQHRMGTLFVEGPALAQVKVEQLEHEFWFGAALANQAFDGRMAEEDARRYREAFLRNFNAAVTENALKWASMEPERGAVNYATVDAMLAWTDERGIPLRGHNVFWGVSQFVQPWVKELDDETLRATLKARALDIGRRYAGRFAEYDLNNEMIHGNVYEERLGPGITRDMARWVKQADPQATLYFNDYDILTGNWLDRYVADIERHLEMGAPMDGVGAQGHLHGESFDPEALRASLDELAKLGMPIQVTEFNFPGQRSRFYEDRTLKLTPEEERAKAQAIVDYYTICFAHPAVEGILMWGFWEGANWIPASSLYQLDWTPTPAAEAYQDLVYKKWWTSWEGQTDRKGQRRMPAFYGTYRISCDGETRTVHLRKDEGVARVSF